MRTRVRRLGLPRPAVVQPAFDGVPMSVGGHVVMYLRDEWRVDEGWWSGSRVRRRYFDLVLDDGRATVVFLDQTNGRWYGHRA